MSKSCANKRSHTRIRFSEIGICGDFLPTYTLSGVDVGNSVTTGRDNTFEAYEGFALSLC